MLRWLDSDPDALPRGPALLLELGCGHGLVGLACAALRPRASLVLSDVEALLPFAERSLAANGPDLATRSSVRPLPFGDASALDAILREFQQGRTAAEAESRLGAPAIVAIGAGICYWECVYMPLAETLEQLCMAGGRALLSYFRRDWKVERGFWTKLLPKRGLQVQILWEGEIEEPDDAASCAPACARTSGEWNARVYCVERAAEAAAAEPDGARDTELQPWLAYSSADYKPQRMKGSKRANGSTHIGGRRSN